MILICYDGSDDARAAIEGAGALFPGQAATVLTVWQPFIEVVARAGVGLGITPAIPDSDRIDEASQERAQAVVQEGVELARAAGLDAQPHVSAQAPTTGRAILEQAHPLGAAPSLMGCRGAT